MDDIPFLTSEDFKAPGEILAKPGDMLMSRVEILETPGETLKTARISKGYSIREMAQKVGCSHVHLLKIERGEKTPSPKLLDQLKRELGLDTFFIAYSNPSSISANFIEHDELIRLPLATGTVVALILDALLKGGFKPTLHKPDKMSPHPVNSLTIDVDLATGGRITIPIKHVT